MRYIPGDLDLIVDHLLDLFHTSATYRKQAAFCINSVMLGQVDNKTGEHWSQRFALSQKESDVTIRWVFYNIICSSYLSGVPVLVSALGGWISTPRGDISTQLNFSARSPVTDIFTSRRVHLFVKCQRVHKYHLAGAETSTWWISSLQVALAATLWR